MQWMTGVFGDEPVYTSISSATPVPAVEAVATGGRVKLASPSLGSSVAHSDSGSPAYFHQSSRDYLQNVAGRVFEVDLTYRSGNTKFLPLLFPFPRLPGPSSPYFILISIIKKEYP